MEVDCHNKLPHHTLTALLIKSLACNIRQQHLVSAYLRGTSQNPRHKNTSGEDVIVSPSVSSLVNCTVHFRHNHTISIRQLYLTISLETLC